LPLGQGSVSTKSYDEPRSAGHHDPLAAASAPEFAHCDKEVFRDVIGHFASGVAIITTRDEGVDYGVTVNAVSSLSLEPPMMLVCLNRTSRTQTAINRSRTFSVNILGEGQGELAVRFSTSVDDKFHGVAVSRGELGNPLLAGALAHLECRVIEQVSGGTHRVFLAGVQRAERFEGAPLAYFRGRLGRLELEQTVPVEADLLDPVLSRHFYDAMSFFTHG
jgi:flavin reductase (DIM6/NTAB) family NADH-FMN oxidoreductase RutF